MRFKINLGLLAVFISISIICWTLIFNLSKANAQGDNSIVKVSTQKNFAKKSNAKKVKQLRGDWDVIEAASTKFTLEITKALASAFNNKSGTFEYNIKASEGNTTSIENQVCLIRDNYLLFNNQQGEFTDTYLIKLTKNFKKGSGDMINQQDASIRSIELVKNSNNN